MRRLTRSLALLLILITISCAEKEQTTPSQSRTAESKPAPAQTDNSPSGLLAQAKTYMNEPMSDYDASEAKKRLELIPKSAPEYPEAQRLLARIKSRPKVPSSAQSDSSPTKPTPTLLPSPTIRGLVITDIKNSSVEYQLAFLDSGHLPRDDDINATRIRYLLNSISQKTGDDPHHIADRTSRVTGVLEEKYGRKVTNQEFLEQANKYFLSGGPKTNYDDLSTLLSMMMAR